MVTYGLQPYNQELIWWYVGVNSRSTNGLAVCKNPDITYKPYYIQRKKEIMGKFKYLGVWIKNSLAPEIEVASRIEQAAFSIEMIPVKQEGNSK